MERVGNYCALSKVHRRGQNTYILVHTYTHTHTHTHTCTYAHTHTHTHTHTNTYKQEFNMIRGRKKTMKETHSYFNIKLLETGSISVEF